MPLSPAPRPRDALFPVQEVPKTILSSVPPVGVVDGTTAITVNAKLLPPNHAGLFSADKTYVLLGLAGDLGNLHRVLAVRQRRPSRGAGPVCPAGPAGLCHDLLVSRRGRWQRRADGVRRAQLVHARGGQRAAAARNAGVCGAPARAAQED